MFGRKKKAKVEPTLLTNAMMHSRRADDLENQLALLQDKVQEQGEELGRLRTDYNLTDHEFDQIRKVVIKLKAAAGGFWRTAGGHVMRIRDMSTDHIKRCLLGNFGGPEARHNMNQEMDRRKEEDYWRSQPMPGDLVIRNRLKPAEELDFVYNNDSNPEPEEDGFVGSIYNVPIYVDKNTPSRILRDIKDYLLRRGQ